MVDAANGQESDDKKKRVNFNQTDFPQFSLEAVLSIPKTICEHYAGHPTRQIDIAAALKREAIMKPKIMKAFYERYNNAKFPDDNIAGNVLVSLGLPRERVPSAVRILRDNAEQAQILKQVAGANYIDLKAITPPNTTVSTSLTPEFTENGDSPSPLVNNSPVVEVKEFTKPPSSFNSPSLHIDLQIHISSDASFEQIDKIFESIAKHLYQHSNNE